MLAEAMALPFRHAGAVLRLTGAWALVHGAATLLLYRLLDDAEITAIQKGENIGPAGLHLVLLLVGLIIGSSIAVGWHRLLLKGEAPAAGPNMRLDTTVWSYIAVAGLMLLLTMPFLTTAFLFASRAPAILAEAEKPVPEIDGLTALLLPTMLLCMVPALVLTTRLSLALPARSVEDARFTLAGSWRLTRGNFWRLFMGMLACYVPAMVLGGLISAFDGVAHGPWRFLAVNAASSAVALMASVFPLAFLALAYRYLLDTAAAAPGERRILL
jgi:hypothetical protein